MNPPGGSVGHRAIHRLRPETVARIAAGEVVERPASVVKELVENAYDAGATGVRVSITGGGVERIAVADDGIGIPPAELGLAVERHATSKLAESEALEGIATLGFRGEALASIASVSRLSITSRTAASEEAHGLRVEGGELKDEFVEGAPPGTAVEVRDLFYNTPARRKFLSSPASEQVEVTQTVGALYLAHPEVALVLEAEGAELLRYPRTDSLRDAAIRVLGEELLDQTIELDALEEDGVAIRGVVGMPSVSRGTSRGLHIVVNGRAVVSRALSRAVRQAYDDYLPRSRFPMGIVRLSIDPHRIDVNVHPTKREIRIAREREVAERLRRTVREALRGAPQWADRAAPGSSRAAGSASHAPRTSGRSLEPDPFIASLAFAPVDSASVQRLLDQEVGPRTVGGVGGHPRLTLHACLFHLYWVAETDDALVLVDQHAASERIVYEALQREGRLARQELVQPVTLSLTARQAAVFEARSADIGRAGFTVEPFGGESFRLSSVPVYRGRRAQAEALPALLDELADGGRATVPDGLVERTAASIACHTAVRAGDEISAEEMARILDVLFRLPESAYACPHGRPIVVRLPRGRLDRWFLRSGT